jgi:aspartate ammonia-lyase
MAAAARLLAHRCVAGIQANREVCAGYIERSLALATALVPVMGYDRAAEIAKTAHDRNRTIREVVRDSGLLDEAALDRLLAPDA